MSHTLYTDADKDRPDVICDRNGQVVLDLCKVCGKAEAELLEHPECFGPRCTGCDLPNGCPEYCWCGPQGAGNAEYASWRPVPAGVAPTHKPGCGLFIGNRPENGVPVCTCGVKGDAS